MRRVNAAEPFEPPRHWMIPPLSRLPEGFDLVEQGAYFALHAPRRTGKMAMLRALAKELAAARKFAAIHFTCEGAEPAGDDFAMAEPIVLYNIREEAWSLPAPELSPPDPWPEAPPGSQDARAAEGYAVAVLRG